jgi:Protein of unknown function (DUF3014)
MENLNKPLIGVAALVVVLVFGGWLWLRHRAATLAPAPPPAAASAASQAPPAEPAIQQPLPSQSDAAPAAPVPALADSDSAFRDALTQMAGADAVGNYLRPDAIIRNLVVTVDNLPRQKLAVEKRPIVATAGSFAANGDELHATLDARNFERYKPLVAVIGTLDMAKLVAVYTHFYPLFQEAYQNLGYPNGYFNDRLVQVIDLLLATPQPSGPIELVQPNVMYTFADPALESRPAGQKLLIRMGPDNAKAIKSKLMELRALITAAPPKH